MFILLRLVWLKKMALANFKFRSLQELAFRLAGCFTHAPIPARLLEPPTQSTMEEFPRSRLRPSSNVVGQWWRRRSGLVSQVLESGKANTRTDAKKPLR